MTPETVRAYARRFSAGAGAHAVTSPLGAWLLLALAAPAVAARDRAAVEEALGADASSAADAARALLAEPHPHVASAAAAWHARESATETFDAWLASLPPDVERGPVPSRAAADEWTRRRTLGLIAEYPGTLDADTMLVLATVLATRVSWREPFDLAAGAGLGAWGVKAVLRSAPGHAAFVAPSAAAGDVGVHVARAEGLDVLSVVAAPGVAPADVLDAAHEVADAWERRARSAFDLSLGDGHSWTVTEQRTVVTSPDGREETSSALLPASSATSSHDLLSMPALGFGPVGAALYGLMKPDPRGGAFAVTQAAVASYGRVGFEAAATTLLTVAGSAPPSGREGRRRRLEVRFARPYAVVAVATSGGPSPWRGLPVFAAWVAEAEEGDGNSDTAEGVG